MTELYEYGAVSFDDAVVAVGEELRRALKLPDQTLGPEVDVDLLPGADSLRLTRVIAALERRFHVEVDDRAFRSAATIGEFAQILVHACEERRV